MLLGRSQVADVRCECGDRVVLIGWFLLLQVLDLGVTRQLVHRLIKLFPFMCVGDKPLAGSLEATKRVAFERLKYLGRRSRACKADPGYVERSGQVDGLADVGLLRRYVRLCDVRVGTCATGPRDQSADSLPLCFVRID